MTIDAFRRSRLLLWLGALFAALLLITSCGKKDKEEAGTETPIETAQKAPTLWRLSDENSVIHLYGTFHLLPEGMDWQTDAMSEAFGAANLLILEADVANADPAEVVALITKHAVAPTDKPLRGRLSAEDTAKLETIATELGLNPAQLDGFEPWYVATILSLKFAEGRGLSASAGVEQQLVNTAEAADKPIAYLETVEEQIGFFATLPEDIQLHMLTATLEELESAEEVLDEMQRAWLEGDDEAMGSLFDKSVREVPALYDVLIKQRNERWAEEIAKLMAGSGNVFVAVGAGHLVGEDSVVSLLRAQGFSIERQ